MLSEKDFEKFNTFLDTKLDQKLAPLNTKIDRTIDQLTAVLISVAKIGVLEATTDAILETVQATAVAIDSQTGINQDIEKENAAIMGQLDRHENWFKKIADKIQIKLEY